jgi:glycosidase
VECDKPNAGFTNGKPWLGVNPNYFEINVEKEKILKDSVLNNYKKLICLRNKNKALVYGDYIPLTPDDWETYAYMRVLGLSSFIIIVNTSPREWTMQIPKELREEKHELVFLNYKKPKNSEDDFFLRPWEARIYRR